MSFQAAKRRRLDQATSTLSKPFKSPLCKQVKTTSAEYGVEKPDSLIKLEAPIKAAAAHTTTPSNTQTTQSIANSPCTPSAVIKRPTTIPPTAPPASTSTISSTPSPSASPELVTLQKQHSALTTRLAKLRRELDLATQALKLEESGQDAELEILIAKWKRVSREAAEELFVGAEERVKRMGGVTGWRENMRKAQERRAGWDYDDQNVGSDVEEAERGRAEIEGEIEVQEGTSASRNGNRGRNGESDEDESFTMDMMLKSLNIELDIIGFDADTQQWI
ncbi:DNA repair protein Dds20/Mei5 [Histoplasma capsulatum var. duboisii H88]|uniref:DNA repair protein Dds20/Mei5 n=2 Tax=Ajellomyces capsulatus TaxID=5037 RepID=F0UGC6_AJEC8|nr:DNA repair protein Dds20/Mei5 [Histoplasma capsulatum var. duboisii H88]